MRPKTNIFGMGVKAGVIGFVAVVVALQFLQPDYDPIHQHISELAIGRYGSVMFFAFSSFAISVFSAQQGLGSTRSPQALRLMLSVAAACLFGAGIFKLNDAAVIHVALIALAFVLLVLAMYFLPQLVAGFNSRRSRITSWGLAAGTAVSVASGGSLPDGIAQRAAAVCILIWLFWVGCGFLGTVERPNAEQTDRPDKKHSGPL